MIFHALYLLLLCTLLAVIRENTKESDTSNIAQLIKGRGFFSAGSCTIAVTAPVIAAPVNWLSDIVDIIEEKAGMSYNPMLARLAKNNTKIITYIIYPLSPDIIGFAIFQHSPWIS